MKKSLSPMDEFKAGKYGINMSLMPETGVILLDLHPRLPVTYVT